MLFAYRVLDSCCVIVRTHTYHTHTHTHTHGQIDSQNPYMAAFVGEPYVYTFNAENLTEVELTVQRILKQPVSYAASNVWITKLPEIESISTALC